MKTKHLLLAILGTLTITSYAQASAWEGQPDVVDHLPGAAYIPPGFDDNDHAQLVIEGVLPNNCFKVGPTDVKVDEIQKVIYVKNSFYYYKEAMCLQMQVPYEKEVDVGVIPVGQYKVIFTAGSDSKVGYGLMGISKATTKNADNFLYAPVTSVELLVNTNDKSKVLQLKGEFSNPCMKLKEVKFNHYSYSDVIEVYPIAEMDSGNCSGTDSRAFQTTLNLKDIPQGRYLVHVRVLNGRAVNKIVKIK